ncbi:MAG: hypothetical protein JWQ43_1785 [Glaciihabitans sp.]|nr:hypothetical protein [Glaciihabitans sp.]
MTDGADLSAPGAPLKPVDYPWASALRSGVMTGGRLLALELQAGRPVGESLVEPAPGSSLATVTLDRHLSNNNASSLGERYLVVAVGSNASPEVMRRKFARSAARENVVVPFVRGTVAGIGVGHSGHCSAGGYIAATPFAAPGVSTVLWASWFDDAQLAALDQSEPNYRRLRIESRDHMFTLDNGEVLSNYYIYESVHGLVSLDGTVLPIMSQADLFAVLALRLPEIARLGGDVAMVADQLKASAVAEAVRVALLAAHMILPSGILGRPDAHPRAYAPLVPR